MENNNYCYEHPHPAVVAECVVLGFDGKELNVLLVERDAEPCKGEWALPGGFVNPDETAEECAIRVIRGATGLEQPYVEQIGAYSLPERDPRERVISVAFVALVRMGQVNGGNEPAGAKWFPVCKLPSLAFDHSDIIYDAHARTRELMFFYPVAYELLPKKFTMRELQAVYEAVLDTRFDRRNFIKKMQRVGILTELDEKVQLAPHREAALYSFDIPKYMEFKFGGFKMEF